MFIVYEYVTCVLAVLFGATLLFTVSVIVVGLIEGSSILAQALRKLREGSPQLQSRWMPAESRDS